MEFVLGELAERGDTFTMEGGYDAAAATKSIQSLVSAIHVTPASSPKLVANNP